MVGVEELSTLVDPAVLDDLTATIKEHMVILLCNTTSVGTLSPEMSL